MKNRDFCIFIRDSAEGISKPIWFQFGRGASFRLMMFSGTGFCFVIGKNTFTPPSAGHCQCQRAAEFDCFISTPIGRASLAKNILDAI